MAGMASERSISSRSPRGLVRCSAVWIISAERRMVQYYYLAIWM